MNSFMRLACISSLGVYLLLFQPYWIENETTSRSIELAVSNHHHSISDPGLLKKQKENYHQQQEKRQRHQHTDINQTISCLNHRPSFINQNQSLKQGSDPSINLLEHKSPTTCGRLKRNWLFTPALSDYAKIIDQHQSNCSIPLANHHFDNTFGLGSHIILWGQALCNGMESRLRMRSHAPEWLWLDQEYCDMRQQAIMSPMLCYFPSSEYRCSDSSSTHHISDNDDTSSAVDDSTRYNDLSILPNITDPRKTDDWCKLAKSSPEEKAMVRAASTEYLFQRLSPLVIQEAQRQIGTIFPNGIVPTNLVTVHIRWGDKFWEMDLPPIQEYINAVNSILSVNNTHGNNTTTAANATTANIYLATEDPRAYKEFMEAIPNGWNVFSDITLLEINAFRPPKGNRASWAARNTKGRAGLVALASLLVGLEGNMFVLTTKSNWSTIMNHLRMNIINPRCDNCTKMIDLRPGIW